MDPLVIVFGLGVGVLIGMTGIGGGSLMTPLLILFAGVHPTVAIGTDLAYGAVTKTLGGWRHLRKGTVDLGVSKWLAFGSVPGSVAGVILLELVLKHSPSILLTGVACALLVVSISMLFRALFLQAAIERERHTVELTTGTKVRAVGLGVVLGFLLGLTSVGSGALIGLALILVFRLTPHRVVGTDVFHAAIVLWAAGLAQLVAGNIDFALMGTILVGSLPGVLIGTALSSQVPAIVLRPALGCVLLGSSLGVLTKAGVDLPTWTIVGVPVIVGIVVALIHRVQVRRHPARPLPEALPA
ncbi:MAG TPA: sulfite exporter TauE/SafE family protein [Baekduia sp.]|uniref:sulfite exporter TauE/SafE family protein n=1 Tax=Baekduia sp. TaxID=2600305 RepID=UPI002BD8445D|nr:sulfite exporter TauE/SafE family protein [Baekduia sp.]HMJ36496.1 sulfite exporter TauE/SafE family protein [Baekduia sp.]